MPDFPLPPDVRLAMGVEEKKSGFDFKKWRGDFIKAGDRGVFGGVLKTPVSDKMADALVRVGQGEIVAADGKEFFELGTMMMKFSKLMYSKENLSEAEVKDLSLLVDWCREFFLQGRFVETAKGGDKMAAWVAFMVNQLTKIAQTKKVDRDIYRGPGESVEAYDLGEDRVQALFRQVDIFSSTFLSDRGLGKQLPPEGDRLVRTKRNEAIYSRLKNLSLNSRHEMMRLERDVWPGRGVEGLYHTKNSLMVAHFLQNGHTLVDLAEAAGKEQLRAKARAEGIGAGRGLMFHYAFDEAEFGMHAKGDSIPLIEGASFSAADERGRGDRILHYDPDALFYIGLLVEYFRNKKSSF